MAPENELPTSHETQSVSPPEAKTFASGRYVVKRLLGEGAQKSVYLVDDTTLGRQCALSMLNAALLDPSDVDRIRREAQTMAQFGAQSNIVTVYDYGEEDGTPFIVCEYVPGGELREELAAAAGPLRLERALEVAIDICRALSFAHRRDIVHRDVKPGNIWLAEDGSAKLGDFGVALGSDRTRLTMTGAIVGSPAYMAPEQAQGQAVDARSDLYSLGCVLYELLTGRRPFTGEDAMSVISQHVHVPPPPPSHHNPQVPRRLERLVLKLLAKNKEERPSSAGDALADLEQLTPAVLAQTEPPAVLQPLHRLAGAPFVGRQQELAALKAALEETLVGKGSLQVVAGEAGIGKTRLARELMLYAQLRGAKVLVGRCTEAEGSLPYLPFVEALGTLVGEEEKEDLQERLGEDAPIVAKLLPRIAARLRDLPEAPQLPPESERYTLFQAVAALLRGVADESGLLLVLEDLHWADKASLLLLQHLARELQGSRLLVVGLYRDVEVDPKHPLSEVLADLRRDHLYERIALGGLPQVDVRALVTAIGEQEMPDELARALYEETEGNPFFVEEILRHLVQEGILHRSDAGWISDLSIAEMRLPEGVKDAIGRRLDRLSDDCHLLLRQGAVLGRQFRHDLLARVSEKGDEELLDLVEEALAALVLEETPGREVAYSFTHALTRQCLLEELSVARRGRLHLRTAGAIEATHPSALEEHAAELAHHLYEAGAAADPAKVVYYLTLAGEQALAAVAYEEGARLYEMAVEVLDLNEKPDAAQHCELLLALGEARNKAGERDRAGEAFYQAAGIAREMGAAELLARAALGRGGRFLLGESDVADDTLLVPLMEEALDALGERDSVLRARLLPLLAALIVEHSQERSALLSQEGVEMARRIGDSAALAYALQGRLLSVWRPENLEERLAIATEAVRLAEEVGDKEIALVAHCERHTCLIELGDLAAAAPDFEAHARLGEELQQHGQRGHTAQLRAMQALLAGRLEEAERLAQEGLAIARRGWAPQVAAATFALQMFALRKEQGRLGELEAVVQQFPPIPVARTMLALIHTQLGREAEARDEFERLAANDFADLPRDFLWIACVTNLAESCAFLHDAQRAGMLYQLLLPYAERTVVALYAHTCSGSVSRHLGLLAATMSRWDESAQHFEYALDMNARLEAKPYLAHTQQDYASMLSRRDAPGDRDKATDLLRQASDTAEELDLKALLDGVHALRAELGSG